MCEEVREQIQQWEEGEEGGERDRWVEIDKEVGEGV
jgi:hypothetical protein